MLVLSRKIGQRLTIGDNVSVVVSRISGNRVTLAIEAPPEVRIVRGELEPALRAEERASETSLSLGPTQFEVAEDVACVSAPRLAK